MRKQEASTNLWNLFGMLRDEGIGYEQYVIELTYILFLKMMKEKQNEDIILIPKEYRWDKLIKRQGGELKNFYRRLLLELGENGKGIARLIYNNARTNINNPVNLERIIKLVDEFDWHNTNGEELEDFYEKLLEKCIGDNARGGQHFTPRPIINMIVELVNPQVGERCNDPACGTFGFMIAADRYIKKKTDDFFTLSQEEAEFQRKQAFSGCELVQDVHVLAVMNAMIHGIEGQIYMGDTLSGFGKSLRNYDIIMSNPPFGGKSLNLPEREDFSFITSNKQLNFLQHIYGTLKKGGRAAVIIPDSVLFESGIGQKIRTDLMDKCSLHTILRLPLGTFAPAGVKGNVLFFTRGKTDKDNTKEVWVYDLRNGMPNFGKKIPLTEAHFKGFIKAYKAQERNKVRDKRWSKFTREEIRDREDNLDLLRNNNWNTFTSNLEINTYDRLQSLKSIQSRDSQLEKGMISYKNLFNSSLQYYQTVNGFKRSSHSLNISEFISNLKTNFIETDVMLNNKDKFPLIDSVEVLWGNECKHSLIIGEGGSGKTFSLLRLWKKYLDKKEENLPIPIFLKLNEYGSENISTSNGIINMIAMHYLNKPEYSGDEGYLLWDIFNTSISTEEKYTPSVILLLDGLDEVKRDKVHFLIKEIDEIRGAKGLQIIITSRHDMCSEFGWDSFNKLNIMPLSKEQVLEYLSNATTYKLNDKILELLKNPMLLNLSTSIFEVIKKSYQSNPRFRFKDNMETSGELLWSIFECQIAKVFEVYQQEEKRVYYSFVLKYILPFIGYEVEKGQKHYIDSNELKNIINYTQEKLETISLLEVFSYTGYDLMLENVNSIGVQESFLKIKDILCNEIGILVNENDAFRFSHLSFEEYFAAIHILNDIEISFRQNEISYLLKERQIPANLRRFIGEIEGEQYNKPILLEHEWSIEHYKQTNLTRAIDLCRGDFSNKGIELAIWNIIEIWKGVRGELTGADLSFLNLDKCNLNDVILRRRYRDKYISVKLEGSTVDERAIFFSNHSAIINSIAYSLDGKKILSSSDDTTIKEWNRETGECIDTYSGHINGVNSAIYSLDSKKILSASKDGSIKEWNVETGQCIKTYEGHSEEVIIAIYSNDNKRILSSSYTNNIREWNVETGECIKTYEGHFSRIKSITYSHDSKKILSASDDRRIKEWSVENGEWLRTYLGHTSTLNNALYSNDGKKILSSSRGGTVREWSVETGKELKIYNAYEISSSGVRVNTATYSEDGEKILCFLNDGTVIQWDINTEKYLRFYNTCSELVRLATFSPDKRRVLCVFGDTLIKELDIFSGETLLTYGGLQVREDMISSFFNFISIGSYNEASDYLIEIIASNPQKGEQLKEELGFLFNLDNTLEQEQKKWTNYRTQIEWKRKLWMIMSERCNIRLGMEDIDSEKKNEPQNQDIKEEKRDEKVEVKNYDSQLPVHGGQQLENAVLNLLQEFFNICEESKGDILAELSRQNSGNQFGFDISFKYFNKSNEKVECRIECKNYKDDIGLRDISVKLEQNMIYDRKFEHWILISPKSGITQELRNALKRWEEEGTYPFKVQVWTRENNVHKFFGIKQKVYDIFYSDPWEEEWGKNVNVDYWRELLEPPIRLSNRWVEYVRNTPKLLLKKEDHSAFSALFENSVEMKCRDEAGNDIDGTLYEYVYNWLLEEGKPSMILLGEFGDGKTFFTYVLSRRLIDEFRQSPKTGWIPIRFSLQDFEHEGVFDSQSFVERRLKHFDVTYGSWRDFIREQRKILVILDGFDEMSKKLDKSTIIKNTNRLIDCYEEEFEGLKVLISSRKHFFEDKQNKERLVERIGNPDIIHISPIHRKETVKHLEGCAKSKDEKEKLRKLQTFHDPIGLASKPLFLQMIKETLKELPEADLSVLTIYDSYARNCLRRKIGLQLEEESLSVSQKHIIENLLNILQEIALKLQESDKEYFCLSDFRNSVSTREWAELLWKITDVDCTIKDDVTARVAVRSLLVRVETEDDSKWPVDFCHRSMREYFVALGVCRLLMDDICKAGEFLKKCFLNYEIIYFASLYIKKDNQKDAYSRHLRSLIEETKNKHDSEAFARLGCNCVNLLYRSIDELPGRDWSMLLLDNANLAKANLSNKNFSGTSLRYANLNNVNFENSDFRGSDLTGVRLEQTYEVKSISIEGKRIYATYANGILREWESEEIYSNIIESKSKLVKVIALPQTSITAIQESEDVKQMSFYIREEEEKLSKQAEFNTKQNIRLLKATTDGVLVMKQTENSSNAELQLIHLEQQKIVKSMSVSSFAICEHLDFEAFVIYDENEGLRVIELQTETQRFIPFEGVKDVTCLSVVKINSHKYLVGFGQKDGIVQVWEVNIVSEVWGVKYLFSHNHQGSFVKEVAFMGTDRIVSSGIDGTICLVEFEGDKTIGNKPMLFKLKLRCKGMNITGLKSQKEYMILDKLIKEQS